MGRAEVACLVQCATPLEFECLRRVARPQRVVRLGKLPCFELDGNCAVFRGGVGAEPSVRGLRRALANYDPGFVLDFGAAGALREELQVGDIVLSGLRADGLPKLAGLFDRTPLFPEFLREGRHRLTRGVIRTGDGDRDLEARSVSERRALAEKTGGVGIAWETPSLARVCADEKIPWGSFRVITDVGAPNIPLEEEYDSVAPRALEAAAWLLLAENLKVPGRT